MPTTSQSKEGQVLVGKLQIKEKEIKKKLDSYNITVLSIFECWVIRIVKPLMRNEDHAHS